MEVSKPVRESTFFGACIVNFFATIASSDIWMSEDFVPILSIPLPEDLDEVKKVEFKVFQDTIAQIEADAARLRDGENLDQQSVHSLLNEIRDRRRAQADERRQLRFAVVEQEVENGRERIASEYEEAKGALYKRIVRALYQSDTNILNQLKELMGRDFAAFQAGNAIQFPTMPPDTQMQTRLQQPEEAQMRLPPAEAERDLRRIREIYRKSENE